MILNVFPLILCIFTHYFVLSITENKQSFFWVPLKQCPAISHLTERKVAHFVHLWKHMKSWFQTAGVDSLVITKLGLMAFLFLTCVISCHYPHSQFKCSDKMKRGGRGGILSTNWFKWGICIILWRDTQLDLTFKNDLVMRLMLALSLPVYTLLENICYHILFLNISWRWLF